jgi:hypothetical protein
MDLVHTYFGERTEHESFAANRIFGRMMTSSFYDRIWQDSKVSLESDYICRSVGEMIYEHLRAYYHAAEIPFENLNKMERDYKGLFKIAGIITSGDVSADLSHPSNAYVCKVLVDLKISFRS